MAWTMLRERAVRAVRVSRHDFPVVMAGPVARAPPYISSTCPGLRLAALGPMRAIKSVLHACLALTTACGAEPAGDVEDVDVTTGKGDGTSSSWSANSRKTGAQLGNAVAAADLDADGKQDLLVGAPGIDKVYGYLQGDRGLETRAGSTIEGGSVFGFELVRLAGAHGHADCAAITSKEDPHVAVYCGVETKPQWTSSGKVAEPTPSNDWRVASGDVNGDHHADLVISESGSEGKVWLFYGSPDGLLDKAAWTLEGSKDFGRVGESLVLADFDHDGFDDLAVGAPADAAGETDGYVRMYRGSTSGLGDTPAWTRRGAGADAHYGKALAAGDFNCDGRPDLAIAYEGPSYKGRVDLWHSSARSFSTTLAGTIEEIRPIANTLTYFGKKLAAADVDGDGCAELVVGEPNYERRGRASLFRGGPDGVRTPAAWTMLGTNGSDFGDALGVGDLDGDKRSDLIVGEPLYDARSGGGTADTAGRVHVIYATDIELD